jgi:hypothetical protein
MAPGPTPWNARSGSWCPVTASSRPTTERGAPRTSTSTEAFTSTRTDAASSARTTARAPAQWSWFPSVASTGTSSARSARVSLGSGRVDRHR